MRHETHVEERYFLWLCDILDVEADGWPETVPWSLYRQLHNAPFTWLIPRDVDRAQDALELRDRFVSENLRSVDPGWAGLEASVLEVLVALAERCSFQTEASTGDWFNVFMDNLGIWRYANDNQDAEIHADIIADIIFDWMTRNYEPNGVGGLFPLRDPYADQRKESIWSQKSEYLVEILETTGFFDSA